MDPDSTTQEADFHTADGRCHPVRLFIPGTQPTGAIALFHGGGWRRGSPDLLHPLCQELAPAGVLCASFPYRLLDRDTDDLKDCIADARQAVDWMRGQAAAHGVPLRRVAAGGGSAGGHLAACAGILPAPSWPESRPDALILLNPVIDQGPGGFGFKRIGEAYHEVSPLHRINPGAPPTCFLVGTADEGVPVSTAIAFQSRLEAVGTRCDLHLFGQQPHGFYRRPYPEGRFEECVALSLAFLRSLGFLDSAAKEPSPP